MWSVVIYSIQLSKVYFLQYCTGTLNTITYNAFYLNVGFLLLLHQQPALAAVGVDTYLPISESEVLRASSLLAS